MLGQRIGNYRITAQIGQGGMGAVYEAVHDTVDRRVAVKVLSKDLIADADLLQRFLNEARALSALDHPGVVKLIDYGALPDGTTYLCLERLYGETLLQRLQRSAGLLPLHDALHLGRQLAAILAAVHHRGLVHRDIKPGNIFLCRAAAPGGAEQVKLLDFGLVKLLADSGLADPALQTRAGLLVGTPDYMPPEQCTGAPVGPAADVYALGVMLYRLVCGELPFKGKDPLALLVAQIKSEPPSLRARMASVPLSLDRLVRQMLDKEPTRRPSMAQVAAQLSTIDAVEAADRTMVSFDGGQSQLDRQDPRIDREGRFGPAVVDLAGIPGEPSELLELDVSVRADLAATIISGRAPSGVVLPFQHAAVAPHSLALIPSLARQNQAAQAPRWQTLLPWVLGAVLLLLLLVLGWQARQFAGTGVR